MALKTLPCRIEHLPWLRLLFMQWLIEQPSPYPRLDEEEIDDALVTIHRRLDDPTFFCRVAIRGKKVVGFLIVELQERAMGKPRVFFRVHMLYVQRRHRAQGVAAALLRAAILWGEQHPLKPTAIEFGEHGPVNRRWADRGFEPYYVTYATDLATARRMATQLTTRKVRAA